MEREEAIEVVKKNYPHVNESGSQFETALRTLIPELAESEDERIRKSIIGFLITISSLKDGKTVSNEDFDSKAILEWVAWLEKQGEQETDEWKEGNIIRHGCVLALVIKGRRAMKSNGELFTVQYPNEWVKAMPNEIEHFLNELEAQGEQIHANSCKTCKDEQKPAWSKEDEEILDDIILCGERHCYLDARAVCWIKSLKERYTWKPSDEQMKLLREVQQALLSEDCHNRFVNFMYELKRLRGE